MTPARSTRCGFDRFIQQAKLTGSDGAANDSLGFSLAVARDTIVAGAPYATVNGNAQEGAVYVFVKHWGGRANATQAAKLTIAAGAAEDNLGASGGLGNNGRRARAANARSVHLGHDSSGMR